MIRTERALTRLPRIAEAWDVGILQAEQVRLLSRVATPATDQDLAFRASGLSVRRLGEEVTRWEERQKGESEDGWEGQPAADEQKEDGPNHRISFLAPVTFALEWRLALELSAAVSGENLAEWALVENLCAECRSGLPLALDHGGDVLPEDSASDAIDPALGHPGDALLKDSVDNELAPAPVGAAERDGLCESRSERVDAWVDPEEDDERTDPDRASNLGSRRAPRSLEQFLEESPPEDPWELHQRIGALAEMRRRIDAGLSKRLFDFWTIGGTLHAGFRSLRQYASEVLGMSERRARYALSIERKLLGYPAVRRAYRRGELSWLQCSLLLRIVRGERSECAWIAFARQVTVLRLEEAVESEKLRLLALAAAADEEHDKQVTSMPPAVIVALGVPGDVAGVCGRLERSTPSMRAGRLDVRSSLAAPDE
jgi:hypothetical protein